MNTIVQGDIPSEEIIELNNLYLKQALDKLYKECEHGDDEHRKWLKDKFEDFYNKSL